MDYSTFKRKISLGFIGFILLLIQHVAYAIVIAPNTIINSPVTYSNTVVDLTSGNFIITNDGILTIENSTIIGNISANNPNLIAVQLGSLNLTNNDVQITTSLVNPTPKTEASYYVIRVNRSHAITLEGNRFSVDKQFRVGLLTTSLLQPTRNITVVNNRFQNFHGVLYLLNSYNSIIDNNIFNLNSGGHIVIVGDKCNISTNSFYFSGLNQLGNSIDLVNAENVIINKNNIFTPTSGGIAITLSKNVLIENNTITGGITYAIHLFSNLTINADKQYLSKIFNHLKEKRNHLTTSNISIINNHMGQNRYGIAATDVENLVVIGNFFTQRFMDAAARKFWTDNSVLLQNVTGLVWDNNIYKEAFTQVNGGDNSMTNFVPFPETGGVVL